MYTRPRVHGALGGNLSVLPAQICKPGVSHYRGSPTVPLRARAHAHARATRARIMRARVARPHVARAICYSGRSPRTPPRPGAT